MSVPAIVGVVVGFLVSAAPAQVDWGFEAAEGFALGPLGDQQGWASGSGQPDDTSVVFVPQFGSRGVRITPNGGFDGAFHLGAASPVFDPPSGSIVRAEQDIMIEGTGGADFLVQTVEAAGGEAGAPVVTLQFTFQGDLLVNGVDTGFNWMPDTTMAVAIEHDWQADKATVSVGAVVVAAGVDISGVTRINQLQYATDDFVGLAPPQALLFDNIRVVPEPASMLLMLCGAVLALRRGQRAERK